MKMACAEGTNESRRIGSTHDPSLRPSPPIPIWESFKCAKGEYAHLSLGLWGSAGRAFMQHFGRAYVGYWETRNLRMASNIRDVLAQKPGARLLVIVGASHKAYLEAYLNQMHDVRLVDAEMVLR